MGGSYILFSFFVLVFIWVIFMYLLFISILPVILVGNYIYKKDSDKEPYRLLCKLFFSGLGAFFLTLIITIFSILNKRFMIKYY